MIPHRLQNFTVVNQITNWIKTHSSNTYTVTNELQLASLDESVDAFLCEYPHEETISGEAQLKWILNKWIFNMTVMHDLQTGDTIRYRGIEIPAKRYDDIKQHLLNETRKVVSYCCKTKLIN